MKENHLNIYYEIKGEGKPLLFLHGFLEDHAMWESIYTNFLVEGFQCILVDLPCHGNSRFEGDECSMGFMAEEVHQLLDFLKINEPILVVGHSMGGYVGLELSQLRPTQLVLLHSNFWADSDSKKLDRNRVIKIVEQGKKKFIQEAIPNLFAPENRENCAAIINQLIEKASTIPYKEIQAATAGMRDRSAFKNTEKSSFAMIHGELDPIISTKMVKEELSQLANKPQLINLQNVGHMSIWEDHPSLIKALKTLLIP